MFLTAAPVTAQNTIDSLQQHDRRLQELWQKQRQAVEAEAKLRRAIAEIGDDRRKLNEMLIETASRLRQAERSVTEIEARLEPLDRNERVLRHSLDERQAEMAEVLAALQRIGHRPPPAILVGADDALAALRSAMLLGAVMPRMRAQAQSLIADLEDLAALRSDIARTKNELEREAATLTAERHRIGLLVEERQRKQDAAEKALVAERQQTQSLAREASDLKELIVKLEKGLDRATRAARAAERAAIERELDGKPNLAVLSDPGRMAPAIAFAAARGKLPIPVNGVRIREFGAPDDFGGNERGIAIATRGGAQVTAPCDGWVVYAAPFRNYGQVLILNAGGGYHVVLAGMERISVDVGQFVLTGEPVGVMGSGSRVAATLPTGVSQPTLYVEFRKDGTPIDSAPWWAASNGEKVRG